MLRYLKYSLLSSLLLAIGTFSCVKKAPQRIVTLTNKNDFNLEKKGVQIELNSLFEKNEIPAFKLIIEDKEIPYQLDDLDGDGVYDYLFFQVDIEANRSIKVELSPVDEFPVYHKLTDAVLKVRDKPDPESMQVGEDFNSLLKYEIPADLKQDNGLIFLEGPAWESDLVGYRFYLDDRTRFDIFGKKTSDLVLNQVSGNYHEVNDWGADILSVGPSLGIGSPGVLVDGAVRTIDKVDSKKIEIITDGPLRSIIRTTYKGWDLPGNKVDVTMDLEIHAHHRYTKLTLLHSDLSSGQIFTTGLVRHEDAPEFIENKNEHFYSVSNWGYRSYHGDLLGISVIADQKFQPKKDDSNSHSFLVNLAGTNNRIEYYFLAAWEFEPAQISITTEKDFRDYILALSYQLTSALEIDLETK